MVTSDSPLVRVGMNGMSGIESDEEKVGVKVG